MRVACSLVPFVLALPACAPEFEHQSELASLRVLAVQKDEPYARPGETVTLTMLDVDASENAKSRTIERAWIAGCFNPPADAYAGCFELFGSGAAMPQLGSGSTFSFQVPDWIITRHGPPPDKNQPPYGVAYVFFAACAGHFAPLSGGQPSGMPFACLSDEGRPLGADDFVAGYTAVYAYDTLRNENPIVQGFEVRGHRIAHDCIGVDCVQPSEGVPMPDGGIASDAGGAEAGISDSGASGVNPADGGSSDAMAADGGSSTAGDAGVDCASTPARCVDVCDKEDDSRCPKVPIRPLIDRRSAEVDEVLAARGDGNVLEQMWVSYYADRGSFSSEIKLLNDAITGWNDDYGTDFRAPKKPGPVHIWAAAHDNRGGVQWIRVTLLAR